MDPDSVEELLDQLHSSDTDTLCQLYIGYALCEVIRELTRIADYLAPVKPDPDPTTLSEIFRKESDRTE